MIKLCSILLLGLAFSATKPAPALRLEALRGAIWILRANESKPTRLQTSVSVRKGDLLFTDRGASVKIRYSATRLVTLGSGTVYVAGAGKGDTGKLLQGHLRSVGGVGLDVAGARVKQKNRGWYLAHAARDETELGRAMSGEFPPWVPSNPPLGKWIVQLRKLALNKNRRGQIEVGQGEAEIELTQQSRSKGPRRQLLQAGDAARFSPKQLQFPQTNPGVDEVSILTRTVGITEEPDLALPGAPLVR